MYTDKITGEILPDVLDMFLDNLVGPTVDKACTIMDSIIDVPTKMYYSFKRKLENVTPKEVIVNTLKRLPVYVTVDTLLFLLILKILGYTITTTLVIGTAVKALALALVFAPLGYILRKDTQ